jgi:hypothetical protein
MSPITKAEVFLAELYRLLTEEQKKQVVEELGTYGRDYIESVVAKYQEADKRGNP